MLGDGNDDDTGEKKKDSVSATFGGYYCVRILRSVQCQKYIEMVVDQYPGPLLFKAIQSVNGCASPRKWQKNKGFDPSPTQSNIQLHHPIQFLRQDVRRTNILAAGY